MNRQNFLISLMTVFLILPVFAKSSPASAAKAALNKIFFEYSNGQIQNAEAHIDPVMIGYQQLVDSMRTTIVKQKQIKITLLDTQVTLGKDIVIIRTGWQKNYLEIPNMTPASVKGKTLFLMQLFKNEWKLTSQSGDNLFAM